MRSRVGMLLLLMLPSLSIGRESAFANTSIVTWGRGDYGQCTVPEPNLDFIAVAGGRYHSLGLRADGSIVAWGRNDDGQCNVPEPNTGFTAVAAGDYHSLGLRADGSIVAWGRNVSGQCNVPAPNLGFTAIGAGGYHTLAVKANGSILAWGRNVEGQCNVPAPNTGFVAVGGGPLWSLALKSEGSIAAWGYNPLHNCDVPAPNSGFTAIAAGGGHGLGLKADSSIVAWGSDSYHQTRVPAPNRGFVRIAAGSEHSLGLRSDGTIAGWGRNDLNQREVPEPNSNFVALGSGYSHGLGVAYWTGACCMPDGACWKTTEDHCPGVWQGEDTSCSPDPCLPFAWSNAGGTLVVHDTGITYSLDLPVPPSSPAPTCDEVIDQIPLETPRVWKVYAAFPAGVQPRLKSLVWAVYPSTTNLGAVVTCGWGLPNSVDDYQGTGPGWPTDWGAGISEIFGTAKTAHMIECYWFGGYGSAGINGESQLFALGAHPTLGGTFYDDAIPPNAESIDAFGSLGFGQSGATPCPDGLAWGICCAPDGGCRVTPESDCAIPAIWHDEYASCTPNPCGSDGIEDARLMPDLSVEVAPIPSTAGVSVRVALPAAATARVFVFDSAGRRVRTLRDGGVRESIFTLHWDGRDDAGRVVPAGVYLVKVATAARETGSRVVLIR